MISRGFDQIDPRVLAAIAGEELPSFTAFHAYGDNSTKFHRKLMKGVSFGKVYGGGAQTLMRRAARHSRG